MGKEADRLEELIKKALEKVPKDAVIAVSGGLDSGLLVALLERYSPSQRLINVCLPYGKRYDETNYLDLLVNYLGLDEPIKVILDDREFKETFEKAVRIIGRPIPHFNIFPLYVMYKELAKNGVENVILGDGPDETMCGYTRHLIMNYLYKVLDIEAFGNYMPTIKKVLKPPVAQYLELVGKKPDDLLGKPSVFRGKELVNTFCRIDMELMRPDMNDMSDKLAGHFGIKNWRPYEDKEVDEFMFNLPVNWKIDPSGEYGKYLLRKVAEKYLPKEIVWRKHKVGGPLVPVNRLMGWEGTEGEFGKKKYLEWQERILNA